MGPFPDLGTLQGTIRIKERIQFSIGKPLDQIKLVGQLKKVNRWILAPGLLKAVRRCGRREATNEGTIDRHAINIYSTCDTQHPSPDWLSDLTV